MSREECTRCHVIYFTTDGEHLCKDLKKRLERQTKAIKLITDILKEYGDDQYDCALFDTELETVALRIIKVLSGRDLGDD